ncbi:hypothetical protein Q4561_07790 [Alteromonas sp. 1_MG-2023]|uniref:hypothetical protein n=1 Tax=Alteromonas sp. 1_MG-2023 TaxID=3062669 RepID=UPI0026E1D2D6|nr:hypothetical protein [Alteromonas sp. 1_MG-2023]MDO6566958.1 hypothetical protein [Alteromonas sp. 1_MG-2023]
MKIPIIPTNYDEWKHCIVKECGISLTVSFIEARIEAMSNVNNEYTRQFLNCYGKSHYQKTMGWMEQAKESLL